MQAVIKKNNFAITMTDPMIFYFLHFLTFLESLWNFDLKKHHLVVMEALSFSSFSHDTAVHLFSNSVRKPPRLLTWGQISSRAWNTINNKNWLEDQMYFVESRLIVCSGKNLLYLYTCMTTSYFEIEHKWLFIFSWTGNMPTLE